MTDTDNLGGVIGRHLHKHIPGNPTVVVDNMAAYWPTRFPFAPEPHIEHQQQEDLPSTLSIRSSVCSGRAERPTINLPGLWFSF